MTSQIFLEDHCKFDRKENGIYFYYCNLSPDGRRNVLGRKYLFSNSIGNDSIIFYDEFDHLSELNKKVILYHEKAQPNGMNEIDADIYAISILGVATYLDCMYAQQRIISNLYPELNIAFSNISYTRMNTVLSEMDKKNKV